MIVDATDCPIEEPHKDVQKLWYSNKTKQHSIKYEVGVNLLTGVICWLAGGFSGRMHDLTMSRSSGLFDILLPGELILADKGYIGEPTVFTTPMRQPPTLEDWNSNYELGIFRVLVENVNGRLKAFACLRTPWRHDLFLHPIVFDVIANLVNFDMILHPLRNDVHVI
jgi:hypothetical protein